MHFDSLDRERSGHERAWERLNGLAIDRGPDQRTTAFSKPSVASVTRVMNSVAAR
jgi:hypothetical protein